MLTARQALEIARDHGLPYRQFKSDILACLLQARETTTKYGKYQWQYFDGYMSSIAHESMCDSIAARRRD